MSEEIKKRGRKKKIEENTGEIENIIEESSSEEIKEVKKRGRKLKTEKEEDSKVSKKVEELETEKENKKEEITKEEVKGNQEKSEKDNKVSEEIDRHSDKIEKGHEKTERHEKNEKHSDENYQNEEKLIKEILNTNVTNLKKMAKEYNIPNFSVMTKYDLVNAVLIEKGKEIGKTYGYGKLDIMGEGSFGFLRNTSIGPDVYVSISQIKRFFLRNEDIVFG